MNKLSRFNKAIYGLGNLSNGLILQALSTYLVFFGTTILGVSGTVMGTMVAISVGWDAVSDPLMGHISDYTHNKRYGRRHLYMIIGTLGLAFFNGFLWFIQPTWPFYLKNVLLFINVLLIKTFITVFVTPYSALGAELSYDYHERTSIQAYRTVFFTLGLAFSTVAGMFFYFRPTAEFPVGQLNPLAYQQLGITLSLIIMFCSLTATFGTFKFIPRLPEASEVSERKHLGLMLREFRAIFDNKNYLCVAGAYLSTNAASAILGAIGLHLFTFTFVMDNIEIGVIFGTIFGLSILSQPFWIEITKRFDKKTGALLGVGISFAAGILFLLVLAYRGYVVAQYLWLLVYAVPAGIGLGGLLTLPNAMIADTVDEEELATGNRSEGLYYGGLTFSYKVSQAVVIFFVGIILDLIGFNAELPTQSESTLIGLGLVVGIGTIIALAGAWRFYTRYELTRERVEAIKDQLHRTEMVQVVEHS